MVRNFSSLTALSFLSVALFAHTADAAISTASRHVQIESIDFQSQVLQLTNFDSVGHDLSGWRFCTRDEDQVRRYSSSTGLNGVNIAAGESLYVHFGNDASAANEINISTIGGGFAGPFDVGPNPGGAYAIGLYFQAGFGSGANIADHIQWSYDGADSTSADERSDEAEGHVWLNQSEWISVDEDTLSIVLNPADYDNEIHSPANYTVLSVPEPTSAVILSTFALGWLRRSRR